MTNETQCSAEMPKYRCHKVVHALKIEGIDKNHPDGGATLAVQAGFAAIGVDRDWVTRFKPADGYPLGYYVVYEDGYKSWSPTEVFEKGYSRLESGAEVTSPLAQLTRIQEQQAKLVKAHPWLSRHIHGGRLARDGLVGPLVDKTAEQKAIDATKPHSL